MVGVIMIGFLLAWWVSSAERGAASRGCRGGYSRTFRRCATNRWHEPVVERQFGKCEFGPSPFGAKSDALQDLIIAVKNIGLLAADRWSKEQPKKSTLAVKVKEAA
jgi:hypothetical protein